MRSRVWMAETAQRHRGSAQLMKAKCNKRNTANRVDIRHARRGLADRRPKHEESKRKRYVAPIFPISCHPNTRCSRCWFNVDQSTICSTPTRFNGFQKTCWILSSVRGTCWQSPLASASRQLIDRGPRILSFGFVIRMQR